MSRLQPLKFDLLGFIQQGIFKCYKEFWESNDINEIMKAKSQLEVYQQLAAKSYYELNLDIKLIPDETRNSFYLLRRLEKNAILTARLHSKIETLKTKVTKLVEKK